MEIKEMRRQAKMTQKEFAEYFGLSKRTLEKWECGRASPPVYLVQLMEYKLHNEKIIRMEENDEKEQ